MAGPIQAEVGGPEEPVRYVGDYHIDWSRSDGGKRPVVGVENIQVIRSNRTHPEWGDGVGWTYQHAASMVYWNDKFYLTSKINTVHEDVGSGQILLETSEDGRNWSFPRQLYPVYEKGEGYNVGLRQPWYISADGRLLNLVGWGNNGLCVREIYKDDTFGPVYTIFQGTSEKLPYYKTSPNRGFVAACDAFLKDDLIMPFWWELLRDRGLYDFKLNVPDQLRVDSFDLPYRNAGVRNWGKGATIFHRKDRTAVILWKFGLAAISKDGGKTWSDAVKLPTIETRMQMIHAQRTDDGRYAILFDPDRGTPGGERRYPLVAITSDDGITFDDMGVIHGEVPDQRFVGKSKEAGPSYVRGIYEGQGDPPGDDMWVGYSVNKENIWVSRVPVPIRLSVDEPVDDGFDNMKAGGPVEDWNIYSPSWARVALVPDAPGSDDLVLEMRDKDPVDYAKAVRVFPETDDALTIKFNLMARQTDKGPFEIEVNSAGGAKTARVYLGSDGMVWARDDEMPVVVCPYHTNDWMSIEIVMDKAADRKYVVKVKTYLGEHVSQALKYPDGPKTVERVTFRTGHDRLLGEERGRSDIDLPGTDEPDPEAVFYIDNVKIQ
jgi:hypothetical protein